MIIETMMGMDDAIEFFYRTKNVIYEILINNKDNTIEIDLDFQEKYERAMNRLRYERDLKRPIKPRLKKTSKSYNDYFICPRCMIKLDILYNFCPHCGRKLAWDNARCLTGRGDNNEGPSTTGNTEETRDI